MTTTAGAVCNFLSRLHRLDVLYYRVRGLIEDQQQVWHTGTHVQRMRSWQRISGLEYREECIMEAIGACNNGLVAALKENGVPIPHALRCDLNPSDPFRALSDRAVMGCLACWNDMQEYDAKVLLSENA